MQPPTAPLWARVLSWACRYSVGQSVVHASTVAFGQADIAHAVVISGASGSGKTALALELMAMGAKLVSDDQTLLHTERGTLIATAPQAIRGLIEWRGVGLLPAAALLRAQVVVWMDLDGAPTARLPDPVWKKILGVAVPCLHRPANGPVAAGLRQYMIGQAWKTHGTAPT